MKIYSSFRTQIEMIFSGYSKGYTYVVKCESSRHILLQRGVRAVNITVRKIIIGKVTHSFP